MPCPHGVKLSVLSTGGICVGTLRNRIVRNCLSRTLKFELYANQSKFKFTLSINLSINSFYDLGFSGVGIERKFNEKQ